MVATGLDILHQQDFKASQQLEIVVGSDDTIRINVDGVCAIRVKMEKGCQLVLLTPEGDETWEVGKTWIK